MVLADDRGDSDRYREIDQWDDWCGWIVNPDEIGARVSRAIRSHEGI